MLNEGLQTMFKEDSSHILRWIVMLDAVQFLNDVMVLFVVVFLLISSSSPNLDFSGMLMVLPIHLTLICLTFLTHGNFIVIILPQLIDLFYNYINNPQNAFNFLLPTTTITSAWSSIGVVREWVRKI